MTTDYICTPCLLVTSCRHQPDSRLQHCMPSVMSPFWLICRTCSSESSPRLMIMFLWASIVHMRAILHLSISGSTGKQVLIYRIYIFYHMHVHQRWLMCVHGTYTFCWPSDVQHGELLLLFLSKVLWETFLDQELYICICCPYVACAMCNTYASMPSCPGPPMSNLGAL
jgi:hypothetical protein